jgi:hypothetical protein
MSKLKTISRQFQDDTEQIQLAFATKYLNTSCLTKHRVDSRQLVSVHIA